jgi:uncharacterized protein YdaU (DUF1376 family)
MPAKWQQWMPFHIDRFMGSRSVAAMHPAARIGYLYLLAAQWQSEDCSISASDEDLAIESGLGDLWQAHKASILRKFSARDDGKLFNSVVAAEWEAAKTIHEKRWGAANRTNQVKSARSPHADRTVTERSPDADRDTGTYTGTSTGTEEISEANASSPRNASGTPDPIEEIYLAYPRKVGKQGAVKAILRAIQHLKARGMTIREAEVYLFRRVQSYARSPAGQDGEFTPHPATWFNRGSYDDHPQEWEKRHREGERSTAAKPFDPCAIPEPAQGITPDQLADWKRQKSQGVTLPGHIAMALARIEKRAAGA